MDCQEPSGSVFSVLLFWTHPFKNSFDLLFNNCDRRGVLFLILNVVIEFHGVFSEKMKRPHFATGPVHNIKCNVDSTWRIACNHPTEMILRETPQLEIMSLAFNGRKSTTYCTACISFIYKCSRALFWGGVGVALLVVAFSMTCMTTSNSCKKRQDHAMRKKTCLQCLDGCTCLI